ncbi:haloacid dehalogenase [Tetragenococcus halophilus subsp. flandriensis]|uniref:HAD family hydrolase n=1 Tax=Tetragenococcus halophilus TaxID=51669 RepID=UPI0023E9FBE7|nr:HAD family phosphatase [Tetragenococcus halophilus]GMA07919.1 haloacid dehalogenase [Tetragenococcus halophilus subsp. flandriensis]
MEDLKYQKETFFFDMDGLLFDTEALYYQTRQRILNKYGHSYTKKDHATYIGKGFDDTIFRLQKIVDDDLLGRKIFNESMKLFQTEIENQNFSLKKGAVKFLNVLNENGKSCYLTSSSSRKIIVQALQKAQIKDLFNGIISGEEVKRNKPAPDIYLRALTISRTNKDRALVFEDAKSGVTAAKQAGVDVIMVPDWLPSDKQDENKAIFVLSDLNEAATIFR